jgi:hypothetical protein
LATEAPRQERIRMLPVAPRVMVICHQLRTQCGDSMQNTQHRHGSCLTTQSCCIMLHHASCIIIMHHPVLLLAAAVARRLACSAPVTYIFSPHKPTCRCSCRVERGCCPAAWRRLAPPAAAAPRRRAIR